MRYLGVPLISGRLFYADCSSIMEKIKNKLAGWKTPPLSFAGRLMLIKSVLQGCYSYGAGIFGLPGKMKKTNRIHICKVFMGRVRFSKEIAPCKLGSNLQTV